MAGVQVGSVRSFIAGDKKECGSEPGKERGYLVQVRASTVSTVQVLTPHCVQTEQGSNQCCSTPWGTAGAGASSNQQPVCYDQFAR